MAGEGDAERLVVLLEARIRDFEKNMAKASGTADKSYSRMRKGSRSATRNMERDMTRSTSRINQALASTSTKIGTLGKAFFGGLVAGGVAGLVSQIGNVASAVAEVGDEARRAGVDVEAFQELKYVAEQNRIGVDSLTDGIKELNLRADEFIITGKGAGAEAFQRLGYDAEGLKEKLEDPSALFTEIIGKLGQLDKAAQIRIADEIFGGTGGEKFVQLIEQGADGIRNTIDEARELGIVMDREMVDKAAAVDREFNKVATTIGTAVKGAIVDAASALGDFLNLFDETSRMTSENLSAMLKANRENRDLFGIPGTEAYKQSLAQEAEILAELERRAGKGLPSGVAKSLPASGLPVKTGGKTRDKAAEEAEREAKAVQNLIAGLEFEKSLLGLSAVEQAKLNALRQAGAAATDEQRNRISALVEETYAEQQRIDDLTEIYDMLGQAGQAAFMGIIDAMKDGKIEAEELGDILSNVLSIAGNFFLNAGLKGLGASLGLPGYATGTANTGGARGEVRGVVHGQEAVIPLPNGGKVPVEVLSAPAPGAFGGEMVGFGEVLS